MSELTKVQGLLLELAIVLTQTLKEPTRFQFAMILIDRNDGQTASVVANGATHGQAAAILYQQQAQIDAGAPLAAEVVIPAPPTDIAVPLGSKVH